MDNLRRAILDVAATMDMRNVLLRAEKYIEGTIRGADEKTPGKCACEAHQILYAIRAIISKTV